MADRNLGEVIDKLIEIIPEDQKALRDELQRTKRSASYKPPEQQYMMWQRAAGALNDYLEYPPITEWSQKVADIFSGKE